MEHQGIEYTVLQTANPSGWKWSFKREGRVPKTGIAYDRIEAIRAAELAINRHLKERRYPTGRLSWRPLSHRTAALA
jgi:hypothetical protein